MYGDNRIAELSYRVLRAHGFEHVEVGTSAESASFDFVVETVATTEACHRNTPVCV